MKNIVIKILYVVSIIFSNYQIVISQSEVSTDIIAKFIAGKPVKEFENLQNTKWYKQHKTEVETGWNKYTNSTLKKINSWINEAEINEPTDTGTVFYPFSGPDFLYANAFFPNANSYIMFGLEKPGNLPDFDSLKDSTIEFYLQNVRSSLRFINKVGYFTTKQMKADFENKNLNGTTHLILFYLSKSGYTVKSFEEIEIDKNGTIQKQVKNSNSIKGIKIEFTKEGNKKNREVIYFRADVSNSNLKNRPEFMKYIQSKEKVITFIKSGSYLLHSNEFSYLKNYILSNSKKILQDDTGIDYSELLKVFDVSLYGKYTKTINEFDYMYQSDLHDSVLFSAKPLPFEIGYNTWLGETLLLYGNINNNKKQKNNSIFKNIVTVEKENSSNIESETKIENNKKNNKTSKNKDEKLVFKVQIKSTAVKIQNHKKYFKNLPKIDFYEENGNFKYTIGSEDDYESCITLKQLAKKQGFPDAFCIAFHNGKKIDISKAIELKNSKK